MNLAMIGFTMLAVFAGSLLPVQFSINSQLGRVIGGPIPAALISFVAGGVVLTLLTLLTTREWPPIATLRAAPTYIFIAGGLLGAIFIASSVILTPRLGGAVTFCFVIAGQLISAMIIDQFGAFGVTVQTATPGRIIGLLLVLVGALMVRLL
jgi:transporter family-2 protein